MKNTFKPITFIVIFMLQCSCVLTAQNDTIVRKIVEEFRKDPIKFKVHYLEKYVKRLSSNNDIEDLIPILYKDLSGIKEESEADKGVMGGMNGYYNKKNNRKFSKKMRKTGRLGKKLVMIEGDSWFNFPTPLKSDMTKLLRKKDSLLVYSSAFGGDWISRMIKDQSYFDAIVRLRPDAFILSGGGNDIVGERLSSLVDLPSKNKLVSDKSVELYSNLVTDTIIQFKKKEKKAVKSYKSKQKINFINEFSYGASIDEEILKGTRYLNLRFFKAMVELELQYRLIIQQINNENNQNSRVKNGMKIIVQGYDYPVPRFNAAPLWCNPWRCILNKGLGSGKWLAMPLKSKGINHPDTQRIVMKAIIFYFNEMLASLARDKDYPMLYHVDNRGLLEYLGGKERARYWFDELHPKKRPYNIVINVLEETIKAEPRKDNRTINTLEHFKLNDKCKKRTERIRNRVNKCKCYKTNKHFKDEQ